jgi:hypothetical protein
MCLLLVGPALGFPLDAIVRVFDSALPTCEEIFDYRPLLRLLKGQFAAAMGTGWGFGINVVGSSHSELSLCSRADFQLPVLG